MAEFAVCAPVFFLMVLGMIEVGRGYMVIHLLENGARIGCRTGILQGKTTLDIQTATGDYLSKSAGINGASTTVLVNGQQVDASTAQANDEITVIATVPVAQVTWVPGGVFLKGNISARFMLRRE